MEDGLTIVSKMQKLMRDNLQKVGDILISGGVDNMEKYQYMLGQARTYQYLLQEISNLLEEKERKDEQGNVIDNDRGWINRSTRRSEPNETIAKMATAAADVLDAGPLPHVRGSLSVTNCFRRHRF